MSLFKLHAPFPPAGDQPEAIASLVRGLEAGAPAQTLLGVTGSGKTFTLAGAIEKVDKPVLVLSHNKTLAAQLYSEFKSFFPENAVEYFISYYDYYLPESYIPQTDTYIAKDASINAEIERLRLSTTTSLVERRDVIVVASVSCIYSLGAPEEFTPPANCAYTWNPETRRLYLCCFAWPFKHVHLPNLGKGRVKYAQLLADGSEIRRREGALSMSGTTPEGALTLDLPVLLPEGCEVPVIELILN